jgi:tRNA-2-methylthio-N6-dimethylallyladenosine synthase
MSDNKTVFVRSYGCQMNVYDSGRMLELLSPAGYVETVSPENADLVILNTCHIREKAAEKVYSELGKLRANKSARRKLGKEQVIAVAGCVAQAQGREILSRARDVDLVFGPQSYHRLPEMLAKHAASGAAIADTDFPGLEKFENSRQRPLLKKGVSAFLTVQEGCDKFCTFCVVPYTRGAEQSRRVSDILAEAQGLADIGVKELTLLGQNVNAYCGFDQRGKQTSLAALVDELADVSGIERIRYMTSHPRDMGKDLIEAHATNGKLMPFLHLPIQSGSDRMLKAMNRGHTAHEYIDLVASIRAVRPDIALSGDFIVGFPGETEADFSETLALVGQVEYASAFSFKYSSRPGTPAAESTQQVPEDIKADRLKRLQEMLVAQQARFNQSSVGKVFPVLLEKPGRKVGQLIGRSPYLQSVNLDADASRIGQIVPVLINAVGPNSLTGIYSP